MNSLGNLPWARPSNANLYRRALNRRIMEEILRAELNRQHNRVTSILPNNADVIPTQRQQVSRHQQQLPAQKVAKENKSVDSVTQFNPNSTMEKLEEAMNCPICMELTYKHEPTSTKCGHIFCKNCITQSLRLRAKCPTCNMPLNGDMIFRIYL